MDFIAVFKRVVPFFLTFAAGLAIASFFVPLTAPSFKWESKRYNRGYHHKCREMQSEVERLRNENLRLKLEVEQIRTAGPGPEFEVPTPPAPQTWKRPVAIQ